MVVGNYAYSSKNLHNNVLLILCVLIGTFEYNFPAADLVRYGFL